MIRPKNIADLEPVQMQARRTGEKLSLYRSLSDAFGIRSLLVHQEVLEPGRRASAPHFHSAKEEIFYVLEGNPSVWLDGEWAELAPGDFIGFNRENDVAHMIVNRSEQPVTLLTIGTKPPDDQIRFVEAPAG